MLIYDKEYLLYERKYYNSYGSIRHIIKDHKLVAIEILKEIQKISQKNPIVTREDLKAIAGVSKEEI